MLSRIRKVSKLGKGSSGTVWEASLNDGRHSFPLALKEVPVTEDEDKLAMVVHEMRMLQATSHKCIVESYGVFYSHSTFQMVMELVNGGSLLDLMKVAQDRIPHDAIAKVAHSLLSALAYLHDDLNVVHRDVKPGNILLSVDGDVKLADLGICTQPHETPSRTWVGTATYMSPERIVGDEYSYPSDVWSAGLVVLEAAMGMYPFMQVAPKPGNLEFWDLMDLMISGPPPSEMILGANIEADARMIELVDKCMHKDDMQRPTAAECLLFPFLTLKAHPEREQQRKQILATWVRGAKAAHIAPVNRSAYSGCGPRACMCESAEQPQPQNQQPSEGPTNALQDFVKSLGVGSDRVMNLFKL
jgi:serine/threonine protein kinase